MIEIHEGISVTMIYEDSLLVDPKVMYNTPSTTLAENNRILHAENREISA